VIVKENATGRHRCKLSWKKAVVEDGILTGAVAISQGAKVDNVFGTWNWKKLGGDCK
jgi:hypothetical protein